MINRKIKLMGSMCCIVSLLYGADQLVTYRLRFEAGDHWLIIKEDQCDLMGIVKDLIESKFIDPQQGIDITDKIPAGYRSHYFFNTIVLPVMKKFINIKKSQEKISKYAIICDLINSQKNSTGTYETFKDAFLLSGYLGLPNEIQRAFANLCYDRQEKRKIDTPLMSEQKWVQTNLGRSNFLLSLNDLPGISDKNQDYVDKNYKIVISNQILKPPTGYFDFAKNNCAA